MAGRVQVPWEWGQVENEALELFKKLLRIDTTNPPGNEAQIVRGILEPLLRAEGLTPEIREEEADRANLVVRVAGNGAKRPFLLHGHLDVVAAEPARWSHPPFEAVEADGCIWGRGAIDMKQMVAMELALLLAIHRSNLPLARDLIVACFADEEAGSRLGSVFMAREHPELLDAEYAIGEGGAYTLHIANRRFYPIMVAEKGFVWMKLTARGEPGHGSIPNPDNSVVRLARAVSALGNPYLRHEVTPVMRRFADEMAEHLGFPTGTVMRRMVHPLPFKLLRRIVFPDQRLADAFAALVHDTVSPTILEGGRKVNQIPSEVSVWVDVRTLPGQSSDGALELIRGVVGPDLDIEVVAEGEPVVMDTRDELYEVMTRAIGSLDEGAYAVPNLLNGFTDAKPLARLGIRTYGFAPVVLPPDIRFAAMFHGDNERIPIEGFRQGLRALGQVVLEMCRAH